MGAGKVLAFLGGVLTLVGTYVIAIIGENHIVGSGLMFATKIPDLFKDADFWSLALDIPVALYYLYLVLFIIFLASGVLQMLSIQSRAVGFIFSLFPLAVSLMFILLLYTNILGTTSGFFAVFFIDDQYGDIFPFLVELGKVDLGAYLLLAGGILGILSVFIERD
ncbi:MAG: hypothetical protein ACFFDH_07315 [Promethearchaeota archaeon]